ncbi:adenylate/guanylate cyclase domain-containing protein [Candidatus Magnetobacterium casense]|uniref:Adenylate/guanylate cyclase domain-containing protein n=1 Tax=Candidatus Magnetobacterium casense TaxID=1455061 RepID=A0ABS6RZR7_9BACT|nr:adenylate/guanylate cyclase domain-containing protein [Candidatus Magnetobacterium casensis]MBV6342110.1 adenylate/guanylate cyclase domain-containing protein [Candidatus Magnetobacterium casensis]
MNKQSKQKAREDTGLVVFVDIVGFSTVSVENQKKVVTVMDRQVVQPILGTLRKQKKVLILPTGDGMAVCFPVCKEGLRRVRKIHLSMLAALLRWAERHNLEAGKPVQMRIGLHYGPVTLLNDFNGRLNSFGDTINMAARVMNAADKGQILLHEDYVHRFLGEERNSSVRTRIPGVNGRGKRTSITLQSGEEVEVNVKHGVVIPVRPARLLIDGLAMCEHKNIDPPESSRHIVVTLSPPGKPIVGKFSDRLSSAQEIAFIQLTGDRLIEKLEKGDTTLSRELRKLWVLMPHGDIVRSLDGHEGKIRIDKLEKCVARWTAWLKQWQKQHPNCDVRLKLFKHPPYFGASFIDWEQPGGFIHVSPYIWGAPATTSPGYDMEWIGCRKSPTYQAYIDGLMELLGTKDSCESLAPQDEKNP